MTTATDSTLTFDLTGEELERTEKKVDQINKRAARRGFSGQITVEARYKTRATTNVAGIAIDEVVYTTRLTGNAPSYEGWTFVAALDWDEEAGLITRPVIGADPIDRTNLYEGWCDHCRARRHRKNTYVVRSDRTGEQMQVGSTCIKDFLGWTAKPVVLFEEDVSAKLEDELGGTSGGGDRSYTIETVLATAWAVIREKGYTPSGQPGDTKTRVSRLLNVPDEHARQNAERFAPKIREAAGMGSRIRKWLLSGDLGGGEYAINLKKVAAAERVTPRNFGLLVSAPQVWIREQEKEVQRERAELVNAYYGSEGDKLDLRVQVRGVRFIEGPYGVTTLYTLVNEEGYVFKWFSTNEGLGDETSDDWVSLRGTVKAHREYRGQRETHLTRCKVK